MPAASLDSRPDVTRIRPWHGLVVGAVLIAGGLGLRWMSLEAGWYNDDYVQHSMLDGNMWFSRGMWDLHEPTRGADAIELIRRGTLPWWTEPSMVFAPLRPLTSALMWWEYHRFGKDAVALHAVSFVLWALFAALTFRAYTKTLPTRAALLAAVVFVLSRCHSEVLSWVASQALLLSAVLGTLSLNLYHAARRTRSMVVGLASVATYAGALLAGENGLAFAGFFFAYELFCARDAIRTRIAALAPLALASVVFLAWSAIGGYGTRNVSYYVDILAGPGQLWDTLRLSLPQHVVHGLAGPLFNAGEPGMAGWALCTLILVWLLLGALGLVRGSRPVGVMGRVTCAWLVGALVSTLPYGGASYAARLGTIPQVGYAAVIGILLHVSIERLGAADRSRRSTVVAAAALVFLGTSHTLLATVESLGATKRLADEYTAWNRRAQRVPSLEAPGRPSPSHVFVMSAVHVPIAKATGLARVAEGKPYDLWRVLSPAHGPHFLHRTGERSFSLHTTTAGIYDNISALVYRKRSSPLRKGTVIETDELTVRVLEAGGAGPFAMEFIFDEPLESPRYHFVVETPEGYEPFGLPPVGQGVVVPPALPPAWPD